ncbi:histidine phosphatase family protein [Streptomyces sp. NPDC057616]|uniref:histidine phosphatase family protein n=1 Tax=Streptomyces sp. NPDC057616 TaxID=3346183 RepID=UPI0036A4F9BE
MHQVIMVRHAETAWNRVRRYYTGRDDPALTPAGEMEASLLGPHLAAYRDARVLCSPALRARRTAELAGLRADVGPELREWSFRLRDGHTVDDGCRLAPCRHDVWNSALLPGACAGECLPEVAARADRVLDRARGVLADGRDVVLVTHGNFIRILTARWLGLPAGAGAHLALRTASIGRLAVYDARPSLLGWNFTPASDVLPPAAGGPLEPVTRPPRPLRRTVPGRPEGRGRSASGGADAAGGQGR